MTYHCQASCARCILRAGPNRHEEVSIEDARDWIRQIAAYRNGYVYVLSLTGGEPFSNLKLLRAVMEFAAENKFYISVVTNGFWATEKDRAKQLLQSLPEICFLSISTDLYHQKFVPFENVKNAMWAAQECNIPFYVSVTTGNIADPDYQRVHTELLKLADLEKIRTGITFPVWRAADIKDDLRYSLSSEPCPEVCQASSSPYIFPDGRVVRLHRSAVRVTGATAALPGQSAGAFGGRDIRSFGNERHSACAETLGAGPFSFLASGGWHE